MSHGFRFGVQASGVENADWRRFSEPGRGPRLLHAVHARPFRRHAARADARHRDGGGVHDDTARRRARLRQRLQAPRDPRQGDGDDRRAHRGALRARHRRRLDEGRLRSARPPVRLGRGADRAPRRGAPGDQGLLGRRRVQLQGRRTTRSPTTTRSRSRCRSRGRRSSSVAAAPKVLRLAGREANIIGINPNLRAGAVTTDAAASASQRGDAEEARAGSARARVIASTTSSSRSATSSARSPTTSSASRPRSRPASTRTPEEVLGSGAALIGTVPEMIDELAQRREEWGVTNIVVGGDNFVDFAPVVAALAGT